MLTFSYLCMFVYAYRTYPTLSTCLQYSTIKHYEKKLLEGNQSLPFSVGIGYLAPKRLSLSGEKLATATRPNMAPAKGKKTLAYALPMPNRSICRAKVRCNKKDAANPIFMHFIRGRGKKHIILKNKPCWSMMLHMSNIVVFVHIWFTHDSKGTSSPRGPSVSCCKRPWQGSVRANELWRRNATCRWPLGDPTWFNGMFWDAFFPTCVTIQWLWNVMDEYGMNLTQRSKWSTVGVTTILPSFGCVFIKNEDNWGYPW